MAEDNFGAIWRAAVTETRRRNPALRLGLHKYLKGIQPHHIPRQRNTDCVALNYMLLDLWT
jgi:hypothetical protein